MWSPVGGGQGVPTFKEAACCSEQPGRGAARDTVGPYECPSDKPQDASPRLIGAQVWRCLPRTCRWSPTCPTAGPDMVCVCGMAAPRQEENRSSVVTEGPSGMGDGGGSHQRVLREVSQKGWPHGDTDHSGNGVGIPGPASHVSTVPTMPVFLGLDCRASKTGSQGAVVLTPIVRPVVRRLPGLGRELSGSRSGVLFLTFRTAVQRLLRSGCCL